MKKIYLITLCFALFTVSDGITKSKYYDKHKKKVVDQHESDLKKRDEILRELNAFLKESSSAISGGEVKLGIPVEDKAISGIKPTDDFHYRGVIPPKIYGYVNTSTLNMRSEDSGTSTVTGKIKFKDRVQILFQSDRTETIKGMTAPWLLVKKDNGDEGWVFGAYISDDIPSEMDKESGKTNWNMIMPASGKLSSRFGKRVDPVSKKRNSFHKGIDIAAPEGTPVYAAEKGVIADAGYKNNGYGNLIIVKHGNDMATYYGHLSKIIVAKGASVSKGELIGKVGSTGKSTGPHLHFEVRKGSQALDPEDFIH
jgi:uncharacterized protein YgiM (DUF1202 family)